MCLSVSLGHGFPWGDVADMGTRVLVVTDDRPDKGAALAEDLCGRLFAMRDEVQPAYRSMEQALDEALAFDGQPVVLADVSDNSGGGAPNDSTFLLRAMLERGIDSAAIGCIWDPIAVEVAMEVGEGVELEMRIGGKMGPMSGDPVDLRVRVGKIARDATQPFSDGTVQLGDSGGAARGGRARGNRHRCHQQPHADLQPGGIHQRGHRPHGQEDSGRQVDAAFLRWFRAYSGQGDLCGRAGCIGAGLHAAALS